MNFTHTLANGITLTRVLLTPGFGVLLVLGNPWALPLFLFCALADACDGWVARALDCESSWGTIADPLADKFLSHTAMFTLLLRTGSVLLAVMWCLILARDLLISYWRLVGGGKTHKVSGMAKAKSAVLSISLSLLICGNLFIIHLVSDIGFMLLSISTFLSCTTLYSYTVLRDDKS